MADKPKNRMTKPNVSRLNTGDADTARDFSRKAPVARNKRNAVAQTIGPIDDLESYVKADWWRDIFNANYLRTDGDVVNDPEITASEVDAYLGLLDVSVDASILDLCCGQGRHTLELAQRGYINLWGVDRSHYLISVARRNAKARNLAVTFREGDARKLRFPEGKFDAIYLAGNSFGYFESIDDDILVLKELRRLLKAQGKLVIDITDGDYLRKQYEPRSWEWIDKNYFVCRERSLSRDQLRLISREVITHTGKGVVADQFYAERLYNITQLTELLTENGFVVATTLPLHTKSKRNQDLGMMARRVLVSARSTKSNVAVTSPDGGPVHVSVLLGDPRLADKVKPAGSFDEDDLYTIERLKQALSNINGFHFRYLDDHKKLVSDLVTRSSAELGNLVFNLCDEGFNNEAEKELHVPAMLEVLGVPYTGGTPQCLAYCYDKSIVRGLASEMDIPVPAAFSVLPEEVAYISLPQSFPLIVKPNFGDSSFGITADSVCYDVTQLNEAITRIRDSVGYERPVLVEEYLTGKDISVGIIGNPPDSYTLLPIIEEDYSSLPPHLPRICGYEAKWDNASPYFSKVRSIPAELPQATVDYLSASCIKLFQRLECRDYARFDWRLDQNGTPRLLEVNPNPGWCWDGHLARMADFAGLDYTGMLTEILRACVERVNSQQGIQVAAGGVT